MLLLYNPQNILGFILRFLHGIGQLILTFYQVSGKLSNAVTLIFFNYNNFCFRTIMSHVLTGFLLLLFNKMTELTKFMLYSYIRYHILIPSVTKL